MDRKRKWFVCLCLMLASMAWSQTLPLSPFPVSVHTNELPIAAIHMKGRKYGLHTILLRMAFHLIPD